MLQHPDEALHVKGSARLLHLSLQRSALLVGEHFSAQQLASHGAAFGDERHPVLLYPDVDASLVAQATKATPAPSASFATSAGPSQHLPSCVIVIDATWRKSLKMLLNNPALLALPRMALPAGYVSQYRVRRAPRGGQFSTLEAACLALATLENQAQRYAPLLEAFDGFVGQLEKQAVQGRRIDSE